MKKLILGFVATTAIATPIVAGTSAQAQTTTSTAPDCVPVTEVVAVPEKSHVEYKYKPAVGNGHIKWSTEDKPTMIFGGVDYVRDGAKKQTVIDSPAVAAVDGVNCEIPDNTGHVYFSQNVGHHVNLPDVFDIEHAGEFAEGTYWATKVSLTIVNDTDTDQEFRIRYADVQDGDRVWVQGTRFTDGLPNNVVPANSSRPFEIEVWHNAVSGADVPDDLTLDFGFELA